MMSLFFQKVASLMRDDRGADLVEYSLLASIIAVAGVAVFPSIGEKLADMFGDAGQDVYDAWEPENPGSFVPPDPG